jgi:hypothetical protein
MSTYEWERGEFKLPAADFRMVRKQMVDTESYLASQDYASAVTLRSKLVASGKGRRKFDFHELCRQLMSESLSKDADKYRIFNAIFPEKVKIVDGKHSRAVSQKPMNPKKSSFKKTKASATSFHAGEASVTFNPKTKTIVWHVPENNHACDEARETAIAKAFFRALDRVKWTNRTGGTVVGNNEYHSENTREGGGANYVTERYGCEKDRFTRSLGRRDRR